MLEMLSPETRAKVIRLQKLIGDAYLRMATNDYSDYRESQLKKCQLWLDEMSKLICNELENADQ